MNESNFINFAHCNPEGQTNLNNKLLKHNLLHTICTTETRQCSNKRKEQILRVSLFKEISIGLKQTANPIPRQTVRHSSKIHSHQLQLKSKRKTKILTLSLQYVKGIHYQQFYSTDSTFSPLFMKLSTSRSFQTVQHVLN